MLLNSNLLVWTTAEGSLGSLPEGIFYSVQLESYSPLGTTIHYRVISGNLPRGITVSDTGLLSGVPLYPGVTTTSKFAIRAYTTQTIGPDTVITHIADRTFTIDINSNIPPQFITPPGVLPTAYYTGEYVYTPIPGTTATTYGYQIEYTQFDSCTITLVDGTLPPGVSVDDRGLLTGFVLPPGNLTWYEDYYFTLEVSNGKFSSLRTFAMGIYNRAVLTADTTVLTADMTTVTADGSPVIPPAITTLPGSIGTVKVGDYFAFKFSAFDVQGDPYQFNLVMSTPIAYDQTPYTYDENYTTYDAGILALPLDLTLDPNSGWVYGRIAPIPTSSYTFDFGVAASKAYDPSIIGKTVNFSITVIYELLSSVTWLTPSDLGSIDNGSISQFYVRAVERYGVPLQYRLLPGSNSSLPQGLLLLPTGDIIGRVSFTTFALDGGTTTFDTTPVNGVSRPTTFDLNHYFTVEAYNDATGISVVQEFVIHVVRAFNEPYENLYIQGLMPPESRDIVSSVLTYVSLIDSSRIYRLDDPYFGIAHSLKYWHCYGLTASTLDEYLLALQLNHYNKQLLLGPIRTARATDTLGNTVYEVVYSEIIDNLVNNTGESISKEQVLSYAVTLPLLGTVPVVYPNSIDNMRTQVIDVIGLESPILPAWMLSTQSNGAVLGFTPAWVICYTQPGESGRVAYDINQFIGDNLNRVDFTADRYEIDRSLSANWNPVTAEPLYEPLLTTFDLYPWSSTRVFAGRVHWGTQLAYTDINNQSIAYINSLGGIDGPISSSIDGDLLVFVRQEGYPGYTDTVAWTNTITGTVIPGQLEAQLTPGVINERMAIYTITVTGSIVTLDLLSNTASLDYVIVKGGATYNQTPLQYPLGPAAGHTVVNWLDLPGPGTPTIFDGGSLVFIEPTDTYTDETDRHDSVIIYPKINVLY